MITKKRFMLIIGVFILFITACVKPDMQHSSTITIGVRSDVPLIGYYNYNGQRAGSEVELAKQLAQSLGVKLNLVTVNSKDREDFLLNGKVDVIIATYSVTKGRLQNMSFSTPYYVDHQGIMVNRDMEVEKVEELNGKKIGVITGANSSEILEKFPKIELVYFADYYRAVIALSLGSIDAISTDKSILVGLNTLWISNKKKLADIDGEATFLLDASDINNNYGFKILDENLTDERHAIAVRKGDDRLLKKINQFLVTTQHPTSNGCNCSGRP